MPSYCVAKVWKTWCILNVMGHFCCQKNCEIRWILCYYMYDNVDKKCPVLQIKQKGSIEYGYKYGSHNDRCIHFDEYLLFNYNCFHISLRHTHKYQAGLFADKHDAFSRQFFLWCFYGSAEWVAYQNFLVNRIYVLLLICPSDGKRQYRHPSVILQ